MIGKTIAVAVALLFAAQVHAQTTQTNPSASPGTTVGSGRRLTDEHAIAAGRPARNKAQLSRLPDFRKAVIIKTGEQTEADYEGCIVRFFAFFHRYKEFVHIVDKFLNEFMTEYNQKGLSSTQIDLFKKTMSFLATDLPTGILRGRGAQTPINLYEAVSVGTALVIAQGKQPKTGVLKRLLDSPALTRLTQGGTNTRAKVTGRIELIRDALG